MAINFTDSPSNGATQTISGRTYTYNSAKNKWDTTATEVAGPTATVYATVDALPTSGNITGSQAFVSGTNRLYIWNGTGWYNIALINTNPTISGVNATYDLAIDGTATTVTITASDPEGLPITYSIASDTSGNTATVTQGTGSNTNVFTVTPSTDSANAGTFSLTFRASDGVNLATAVSEFTLQFTVQNQRYTTALITSVGANNAVNTAFDDKSASDHTISAAGNAHQTTFSPYRHGGHSLYLDGDDAIGVGVGSYALDWSNGQTWTIEFWMKRQGRNPDGHIFMKYPGGGSNISGIRAYVSGSEGRIGLHFNSGTELTTAGTRANIADGDWHHVAVTRGSGYFKIWVDGQLDATVSNTASDGMASSSSWAIGRHGSGTGSAYLKDTLIRDFRIVGSEVYTSNFTAPTEPLTAISGTQVLIANNLPYLKDSSSNEYTLTYYGNPSIEGAGPFDKPKYAAATHLGSSRFDGSGDYLEVNGSTDFQFGTGDFTVECWVYFSAITTSALQIIFASGTDSNAFFFHADADQLSVGTTSVFISNQTTAFSSGQWYHVAACRSGTTLRLFKNGTQVGSSVTNSTDWQQGGNARVGTNMSAGQALNGHIADLRVVKGTAVYTSDFTPPTAPLTAVTNTKLLVQSTDAGIIDKSQSIKTLALNGNVKSSTTQTKYLTSSMYFDGTGDYIQTSTDPLNWLANLSSVGTIEAWVYCTNLRSGTQAYQHPSIIAIGSTYFSLSVDSAGTLYFYWYNGSTNSFSSTSPVISANTWAHVAAVITNTSGSNNVTLYVNGSAVGTGTYGGLAGQVSAALGTNINIGWGNSSNSNSYWPGYISDLRITGGLARYTSNFTPPTAALQG